MLAVVLYEMSRRRERGDTVTWADAFGVINAPSIGAIIVLGLMLLVIFLTAFGSGYYHLGPDHARLLGTGRP